MSVKVVPKQNAWRNASGEHLLHERAVVCKFNRKNKERFNLFQNIDWHLQKGLSEVIIKPSSL
jgi:hypothetical protein